MADPLTVLIEHNVLEVRRTLSDIRAHLRDIDATVVTSHELMCDSRQILRAADRALAGDPQGSPGSSIPEVQPAGQGS